MRSTAVFGWWWAWDLWLSPVPKCEGPGAPSVLVRNGYLGRSGCWLEGVLEGGELFEGQLFGAGLRGDGCGGKGWGDGGRLETRGAEVVGEGLALLGEALLEEGEERALLDLEFVKAGTEGPAEDGGMDLRGWEKGRWRQGEQSRGGAVELGGDGEQAVVAGVGLGCDAVGDFALDH